ncbi:MAG TPA: DUF4388 domain-containing protein [Acidimicrobiales bacterium]|nr:DUF4388 domain-containing protein [Acidimicrobiales bacterium]
MSLQGSLDAFALPDVLALLATAGKSGELRVDGDGVEGRIWMAGGEIVGGIAGRSGRPVDALFEILRLTEGTFVFDAATEPRRDCAPVAASALLAEAQDRLTEWRSIEAVVPAMTASIALAKAAPDSEIRLTAAEWRVLVAVAAASTVDEVATLLDAGEFDTCKQVKGLVERGLIDLQAEGAAVASVEKAADAAASRRQRKGHEPTFDELVVASSARATDDGEADEVYVTSAEPSAVDEAGPVAVVDKEAPEAAGAAEVEEDLDDSRVGTEAEEGIDRGMLLKFLSSVRS